jgi:hypothetical protein
MEKFNLGGTADSSESGGANIGGTLGSSIMKKGGSLKGKQKNLDLNKNGKLDSEDFKMIRGKMKDGGSITKMEKGDIFKVTQQDHQVTNKIFKFIEYNKEGNIKAIKYPNYYGKSNPVNIGDLTSNGIKILSKEEIKKIPINPIRQMANGGLANVPESFPETDAMSYKNGGGVGENEYDILTSRAYELANMLDGLNPVSHKYKVLSQEMEEVRDRLDEIDENDNYKNGGVSDSDFERDYKKVKNHIKEGYGNIDSGYVETTWENMSNITYSAIEDKLIKRLKKDGLFNYANGGSTKGFEYSIGGL